MIKPPDIPSVEYIAGRHTHPCVWPKDLFIPYVSPPASPNAPQTSPPKDEIGLFSA